MKWKNSQKGKTQLKFVQDKADGKEGPVVHTLSALICSLENVKDQHLMGKFGVRRVGPISSAFGST